MYELHKSALHNLFEVSVGNDRHASGPAIPLNLQEPKAMLTAGS
jgi:hypothetical protein